MSILKKVTTITVSAVLTLGLAACDSPSTDGSDSSTDSGIIVYNVTMTGKKLVDRLYVESIEQVQIHSEKELTFTSKGEMLSPMYNCAEIHLKDYTASPTNWDLDISEKTEYQYDNGCVGNIEDTHPGMIAVTDSGTPAISFFPQAWEDKDSLRTVESVSVYFKYVGEVPDGETIPEDIDLLGATFSLNYIVE